MSERVAVVLSGAAARGAFQAGALEVLIPALRADGLEPTLFLGTSAGSINAVLWGSLADLGADECGRAVVDVWERMGRRDVMAHPVWTLLANDAPRFAASALGLGSGIAALLDTAPLARTAHEVLDTDRLARNIADGVLEGVGVAATRLPPPSENPAEEGAAHARTTVFVDVPRIPTDGIADPDRAVDVAPGHLLAEHVLASSAIPLAFPPQWVTSPGEARGWYVDGGARLNTPLRPAVALGVDRILVIAAMSTEYGSPLPPSHTGEPMPNMAASGAQMLHTLLADRMAEDLRTLRSRNRLVAQAAASGAELSKSGGEVMRAIPVMAVSPPPGALGVLAQEVLSEQLHSGPLARLRHSDAYAMDRLLHGLGDGPGRRELLSYLFFDQDYFAAQIDRGRAAATAALAGGWQSA